MDSLKQVPMQQHAISIAELPSGEDTWEVTENFAAMSENAGVVLFYWETHCVEALIH